MAKFSIIIPVYNVEPYIKKCLDSVSSQTFKDYEVIIVDDGSKDNSGKIVDEYATKNEHFKVIHQENKGVSAARNAGIQASNSDYICFVDSDDYIDKEFLEMFHLEVVNDEPDVIICGVTVLSQKKTENKVFYENNTAKIKYMLLTDKWPSWVWNKCFRKKSFSDFSFREGKIFEDMYFIGNIIKEARTIRCITKSLYFYNCFNQNSITKNKTSGHEYKFIEAKLYLKQKALENGISDMTYIESTIMNLMRNCLLLDLVDGTLDAGKRFILKEYLSRNRNYIKKFKDRFWVDRLLKSNDLMCKLYARFRFRNLPKRNKNSF